MDTIEIWLFLFVILCCIMVVITSTRNKKIGKTTPIIFRHIQGMPNLKEGIIIEISSNKESINIDDKYFIPKNKVKSKIITNSKVLNEIQKSVIQRSLLGIVVAGPLGAIVGGMSGIGTKKKTELVHFLTLDYIDENDIEHSALFALEDASKLLNLTIFTRS